MKTKLSLLSILVLSLLNFNHAKAQKSIYTTRGGISLGFGVGASYQQSDLPNSRGTGFDFTLGTPLYRKEGAFLGADWKFRFLTGENKAFDHRINTDATYSNLDYKFCSYDLEFGLTLNRLRERTRLVITGFAGAGITRGRTFADLYDGNGALYDFTGIDPDRNRKRVYQDLVALSDNDFETSLNDKSSILPTAGIYIGYQFTRSFSLGIEQKTSFSLTEQNSSTGIDLDNRISAGTHLDKNHFTAISFRWNLGSSRKSSGYSQPLLPDITNVLTDPVIPVTPDNPVNPAVTAPPYVKITNPGSDPYRASSGFISVKADIRNAGGSDNISFYQDGIQRDNFTYNSYSKIFTASITLHEGDNNLRILVRNAAGGAEDRVRIIMGSRETVIPAPTVRFTYPYTDHLNADMEKLDVSAQLENVSRREDIQLLLNGRTTVFNFHPENGTLGASVFLAEGTNILRINAGNPSGSATDEVSVNYHRAAVIPPPVIIFIDPGAPVTVQDNLFALRARVRNVGSANDITLSINGSSSGNFNFNSSGEVNAKLNLREGLNTIEISGRNEAGSRAERMTIRYERPVRTEKPVVSIRVPAANPYRTSETATTLQASISGVKYAENIILSINGINSRNFSFSDNTGEFMAHIALSEGSNTVTITAQNEAGRDVSSRVIMKEVKPCPIPSISLMGTGRDQLTTADPTYVFSASLGNVEDRNQLALLLNSIQVPFAFNGTTISYTASLKQGENTILLTAQNGCGENNTSVRINYIPAKETVPCHPPKVDISLSAVDRPDATHELTGTISNIKNKSDITVMVNGSTDPGFQYVPATGQLSAKYSFKPGTSTVTVKAGNACGNDSKTVTVNREEPCHPPKVSISLSAVDRPDATHELTGTISNIKNKSDITVMVNGSTDPGFQYVPATGQLSAKYSFKPGTSTVTVKAGNACGNDSKTVTVNREEPCQPPKVDISLSAVDRPDATHELTGTISNIKNKSDITVMVNGSADPGFQYVPATGQLSAKYSFKPGTSTVTVKAGNACGNDSKTVTVNREEPCLPPKVSISLSAVDRPDATHELTGTISNIKNKSDITVMVNGSTDPGFQYIPATGQLSAKYSFKPGTSTVTVKAGNACGNDSKTVTVNREEPCHPPKVSISLSAVDRPDATHELTGTISNIKNKSDITVMVNGSADPGFQYVPATGHLSAKYSFKPGTSTVTVKAGNACGNDSKTVTVNREEPCLPPKVDISLSAVDRPDATHELTGTISNIKNKSDITVMVNGSTDPGFQYVPATGHLSAKYNFKPGTSTVTVKAGNACGNDSKTVTVNREEPCLPPKVDISLSAVDRPDATHELTGTMSNIKNKSDITMTINGKPSTDFSYDIGAGQFNTTFNFSPGTYIVAVTAENSCGRDLRSLTVNREEEACGTRINPGNASWQFCMVTPKGTFNRENLEDHNFRYSGPATSLFIQPTAGGGMARVNGMPYNLKSGQYYLFTGNLTVTVSSGNSGSMGQWSVCIESDRVPVSANGNKRPKSPCEIQ